MTTPSSSESAWRSWPSAPASSECVRADAWATRLAASLPSEPSEPGRPPGGPGGLGPARRPLVGPAQGDEAGHLLAGDRVVGAPLQLGDLLDEVGPPGPLRVPGVRLEVLLGLGGGLLGGAPDRLRRRLGADGRELALERQRRHGDAPAVAGPADEVRRRDAGVGQEHLVERRVLVHLVHRADLDAGLVHRQHEVADAAVLRHVGVGAGEQQPEVGVVGARAPQLLAVDDPLVAVLLGVRRQAGEVGAVRRLAEQLAPRVLARDGARQQAALLLVGAVGEQRRRGEAHAAADRRCRRRRRRRTPRGRSGRPSRAGRGRTTRPATSASPSPTRRACVRHVEQRQVGVPVVGEPLLDLAANVVRGRHGQTSPGRRAARR